MLRYLYRALLLVIVVAGLSGCAQQTMPSGADSAAHPWQLREIVLTAENDYANPYMNVDVWIRLQGPDFDKRVYGFWDGGDRFVIRYVATAPGQWHWKVGSNQPTDAGLNGLGGQFTATAWSGAQKRANPNRRGFIRSTANGHALEYADGTPFFMVGDTWLAGSTWRLPYRGAPSPQGYTPGPGIGFEDAVQYRKDQGFNSVSMISAFPNWDADTHPSTYANDDGIYLRNAWEKFDYDVGEGRGVDASGGLSYWGTLTAKSMRDEYGHLPFAMSDEHAGVSNFNRLNPAYFRSLDKKMAYLSREGMTPLLETVRRDVGPSWNAYFDFNETFARFMQYLVARYGAYNLVFSGIHLDWVPEDFSLTAQQFNEALTYHRERYGPPPFGQPVTALIDRATHTTLGHVDTVPWLDMHSVGNKPRDHRVSENLEAQFALDPPLPTINFEPYYTGWHHEINKPGGERPDANSPRDNYFARAQMYGSVLSGGLSGHVHGTAAYDITATGEPDGARPHIWEALQYRSAAFMQPLKQFVLSRGKAYSELEPASDALSMHKAPDAPEDGLDGWSYMMRTPDKELALLYFENNARAQWAEGFTPGERYQWRWFNPATGQWGERVSLTADESGRLALPSIPPVGGRAHNDWAARLTMLQ